MPERRTKNRSPGLPSVLRAHNDLVGAADALAEAVALHEEKGNVLPAKRCRQLLWRQSQPEARRQTRR